MATHSEKHSSSNAAPAHPDAHSPPSHAAQTHDLAELDTFKVLCLSPQDVVFYTTFPPTRRAALLRKIDIRLVPMLATLYLVSHIDRANIGNAKIEGMPADLALSGAQWNTVLAVFFAPYVLLEVPSNMLLSKFTRPSWYLGFLMVGCGLVMACMGVVSGYAGVLGMRVLLGVFEAGFFPGAVYLTSAWYMPRDIASRIAYFPCAAALSGAFSGLLAAAIARMDGLCGYRGWRWIFILEGLATVVLGVFCFFWLIDSPALSGKWLDRDEMRFLEIQKLIKDGGRMSAADESRVRWNDLKAVLKDWRLYLQSYIMFCAVACSYGTKFTLPSITKGMGFSNTNAQLMTVPPYVCGALASVLFAWLSDRFYWRLPFVAIPMSFIFVGYSVIVSFQGHLQGSLGPSFFAIILTCMGIYPSQTAASSWAANNLAPSSRRAVGIAFNFCVGSLGGVVGSFMYLESERPVYNTGFGLSLAFGATGFIIAFLLEMSYKWGNSKRAKLSEEEVRARYTDTELLRMGNTSPFFRYTL